MSIEHAEKKCEECIEHREIVMEVMEHVTGDKCTGHSEVGEELTEQVEGGFSKEAMIDVYF